MADREYTVAVLGPLSVRRHGSTVELPEGPRRLTGLLSCRGPQPRGAVAEALWPGLPEGRARANLRSALWRIQKRCPLLIGGAGQELRLAESVELDLTVAGTLAYSILQHARTPDQNRPCATPVWAVLTRDVLPDWFDEWALVERERFRQLRLHALEQLASLYNRQRRFGPAIDVATHAVQADPLRESAHRMLIAAHQGEGNHVEARRAYERCRRLLGRELGLEPTPQLLALITPSLKAGGAHQPRPAPSPQHHARGLARASAPGGR
ncbi:AfsR/SARP family transcriptional regulator [Actinomadura rupiterrae]|uniref:AfsR/SARP family transcriptional regulator n=1 Tax=Actinomadura rupiterrae TaxID=559627 RepID=UPI0020A3F655|nr:BTAD domain-containing putative transcriptional regulator [Actinomadura rupiterrae]MCP2341525.1 DNA-binding SARP family transcriptional activator [Actinomadura rupiterrae]